jgi:hypothetical protein
MSVYVQSLNATIAIDATTSDAFCVQDYTAGSIQPPATTGTQFTIHVSNNGSNFNALQDAAGNAIAAIPITANETCPLPAGCFSFKWVKLVSNQIEVAARTIPVFLKAA